MGQGMKHWIGYAGCTLLGMVMGFVLKPGAPDADGAGDLAGTSRSSDARTGPRAPRHGSSLDEWADGVREDAGSDMVSVPTALIREISAYPAVQSPRDSLFRQDDPVERLLGISPHEKEQMVESWKATRKRVEDLEVRSSRSEQLEDGSVTIEIPDLAQSLKPMAVDFELAVEQVLGDSRARTFMALKRLHEAFSPDTGARNYHLKVEAVGNGSWRYHITYDDQQGSKVWVGDSVPGRIRHITDAVGIVPSISQAQE